MEVPGAELRLDLRTISPRGGQVDREPLRSASGLLDLGEPLLDLPAPVALLERVGQPAQVPERERWDMDPHRETFPAVRPGELERAEAADGAAERRVPPQALSEPERPGGFGEVEVEPVGMHFEPVRQPPQEPGRRRPDYGKIAGKVDEPPG